MSNDNTVKGTHLVTNIELICFNQNLKNTIYLSIDGEYTINQLSQLILDLELANKTAKKLLSEQKAPTLFKMENYMIN